MSVDDLQRKMGGNCKVKKVVTVRSQEELARLKQQLGNSTIYRAVQKDASRGGSAPKPVILQVSDAKERKKST